VSEAARFTTARLLPFGFRVRGQQIYFTLGDLQSDIWVTEMGHE
jgi:hypothetical protein